MKVVACRLIVSILKVPLNNLIFVLISLNNKIKSLNHQINQFYKLNQNAGLRTPWYQAAALKQGEEFFFEVYTSSVSFGSLLFYFFVLTKFKMKPFCFCTYQIGYSLNLYSQKLVLRMFSLVVFEVTLFSCFSPLNGMITRAEIESANKTSFIVGLAEGMPYISLHRIIYPTRTTTNI